MRTPISISCLVIVFMSSCMGDNDKSSSFSIRAKNSEVSRLAQTVDSLMMLGGFSSADSIYDELANKYLDSSDIYFIRLRQIDTKIFTHKWDEAKKLVDFCFVENEVPGLAARGPIYFHQYMATIERKEGNMCCSIKHLDNLVDYAVINKQKIDTEMIILNYQLIIDDKRIDSALIATQSLSSIANLARHETGCP